MATIRLCDWTKERLAKDEETTEVTIGTKTFEVGKKGLEFLISQLEGETPPNAPQVVERVVEAPAQAAPAPAQAPQLINVETQGDPFAPGPGSLPMPPQAGEAPAPQPQPQAEVADEDRIMIPEDTKRGLPMPSEKHRDRVFRESTVFEQGTLAALNPGKSRSKAVKKLADRETTEEQNYMQSGRGGINVGRSHQQDPRFYDDE